MSTPEQVALSMARTLAFVTADNPGEPRDDHVDVRQWLLRMHTSGRAHGSELVEAFGRPARGRPGFGGNDWSARSHIEELVKRGSIVRKEHERSASQRFFGVGGLGVGEGRASTACAEEFWYEPASGGVP